MSHADGRLEADKMGDRKAPSPLPGDPDYVGPAQVKPKPPPAPPAKRGEPIMTPDARSEEEPAHACADENAMSSSTHLRDVAGLLRSLREAMALRWGTESEWIRTCDVAVDRLRDLAKQAAPAPDLRALTSDIALTKARAALDAARRTISVDHPVRIEVEAALESIDAALQAQEPKP